MQVEINFEKPKKETKKEEQESIASEMTQEEWDELYKNDHLDQYQYNKED